MNNFKIECEKNGIPLENLEFSSFYEKLTEGQKIATDNILYEFISDKADEFNISKAVSIFLFDPLCYYSGKITLEKFLIRINCILENPHINAQDNMNYVIEEFRKWCLPKEEVTT